jgi:hypothetical protein
VHQVNLTTFHFPFVDRTGRAEGTSPSADPDADAPARTQTSGLSDRAGVNRVTVQHERSPVRRSGKEPDPHLVAARPPRLDRSSAERAPQ